MRGYNSRDDKAARKGFSGPGKLTVICGPSANISTSVFDHNGEVIEFESGRADLGSSGKMSGCEVAEIQRPPTAWDLMDLHPRPSAEEVESLPECTVQPPSHGSDDLFIDHKRIFPVTELANLNSADIEPPAM